MTDKRVSEGVGQEEKRGPRNIQKKKYISLERSEDIIVACHSFDLHLIYACLLHILYLTWLTQFQSCNPSSRL